MKKGLSLSFILVILLGLTSCGFRDKENADAAARQAINDWALSQGYPYEVEESAITMRGTSGHAEYIVYIDDVDSLNYPMYFYFELKKIGEQWIAEQKVLEPAIEITVLDYDGSQCVELGNRSPNSSPCLRLKSVSDFNLSFGGVCIGGDLKDGSWTSSCGHSLDFPPELIDTDIHMTWTTWAELGNGHFEITAKKLLSEEWITVAKESIP